MKPLCLLALVWCVFAVVAQGAPPQPPPKLAGPPPVEMIADAPFLQPSSTLEFRFARPMVSRDEIGLTAKQSPVAIAPAQPGVFTWLSRSSGVFVSSRAWPLGAQFAVTLPAGLNDAEGKPLAGSFRATLRTPPFGRTAVRHDGDEEAKSTVPVPKIMLAFNLAVDPSRAEEFFQFVDSTGRKVAAKLRHAAGGDYFSLDQEEQDWDERWRLAKGGVKKNDETSDEEDADSPPKPNTLVVTPASPLTPGGIWRMEMKRGLVSKSGLKTSEPFVLKLGPVRPFVFEKVIPTNYINSRRILTVEVSQPLAPDITSETAPKFFRVEPPVPKLRFEYENSTLAVLGEFELGREYRLEVDPAVVSEDGLPFQGNRRTPFRFGPVAPRLYLPSVTGHQIRGGLRKFEALSANLQAIKVKAQVVAAEDAAASVKAFEKYNATSDFESGEIYQPMPPGLIRGQTIFERTIELPADALDTRQHTALDWNEILGAQKAGVIFLTLEGVPRPGVSGKHPGAQALLQLTDIGVLWKKVEEGLRVTAFSMSTGQPMEGATVSLLDKNFAPGGKGKTDAEGTSTIAVPPGLGWMVVTKGDDVYAFSVGTDFGNLPLSGFNVRIDYRGWAPEPKKAPVLRGFIFTDRPLYRPGETVHVKGYIRDVTGGGLVARAGLEGVLRLKGIGEKDDSTTKIRTDERGAFDVDLKLKGSAYGDFTLFAEFGDTDDQQSQNSFNCTFDVSEYQPNAFEVKLSAPDRLAPGADLAAKLAASYLFGAPLTAADVRWTLYSSRVSFSPDGFENWHFGAEEGSREKNLTLRGDGKLTGAEGLTIQPKLPEAKDSPYDASLTAEVTDINQQTVSETIRFVRDAADFYLGLAVPEGSVLRPGDEVAGRVVAIQPGGTPVAQPVAVSAELIRTRFETVRVQGAGKAISFRSEKIQEVVGQADGRTLQPVRDDGGAWKVGEGASVKFKADKAGEYLLRVTARDSAGRVVTSQMPVFVSGQESMAWDYRNPAQVDLVADKAGYHPGDTARLLVKTPISGEALVTIERGERILRTMRVKLEGNAPAIEIPLGKDDGPNVFASVVIIRGREQSTRKIKTAEYRYGVTMLKVDDVAPHLQIAVTPTRATVEPGEEVETEVIVRDGTGAPVPDAEVTFFAADEGVLQITGYKRPDPHETFYAPFSLAVRTGLTLYDLLPEDPADLQFSNKGYLIGGGGQVGSGPSFKLREDFPGTACWFPALKTDAAGKVSVRFSAPDAVTRYRLLAVVHAGEKFGSGESAFSIRKPLMVLSALGQFANVGDTVIARAVVRNDTGADASADVKLELDQTAEPAKAGGNMVSVAVKNGESRAIDLPVRLVAMGKAQWTWSAHMQSGGKAYDDHLRASLKVGSSSPVLHETYETELSAASSDLLAGVNPQLLDGVGTVTVTVANTRLAELRESAHQLLEYPYGCAEQTISSMIPWALLPELRGVMPDLAKNEGQAKNAILKGLTRLAGMQTSDGGLSYWPGGERSSLFASAYGALANVFLGRAGFVSLPSDDRLYDYLSEELRGTGRVRNEQGLADRALAVYALAAAGRPEPAYHEELFRRRKELSYESRALLALAILEAHGSAKMVDDLLSLRTEAPETFSWFGGEARERAVQLLAWTLYKPKSPEVGRLTKELLGYRRNGHWGTTQQNAWALLALARYYAVAEDGGKPVAGTLVRRGNEQPFHVTKEQPSMTDSIVFTPTEALQPVVVRNPDKGTLFGETRWVVRAPAAAQPRQDRGYAVSRSYRKLGEDGKLGEAADMKVGDRILVTLRVETGRPGHFVAIDDPLPAIFEAVNPAFRSQEVGGEGAATAEGASDYHEMRADRVIYFCDHLPPGAFVYRYLARVRAAGSATAGPTKVEEMYRPERFGLGESTVLNSKLAEEK